MSGSSWQSSESLHVVALTAPPRWSMRSLAPTKAALVRGVGPMDWSSAGPLWQRQSAGESRWARTEAVGEGRATSPTSLQPRVTQMYELLMQLASGSPTTGPSRYFIEHIETTVMTYGLFFRVSSCVHRTWCYTLQTPPIDNTYHLLVQSSMHLSVMVNTETECDPA